MDEFINPIAILIAALATQVTGFIWYNPKVFGTIWMKETGMTKESMQGANMLKITILSIVYALMLSLVLAQLSIHQMGVLSLIGGDASNAASSYLPFIVEYHDAFRTFKHGALHGFMFGLFAILPIIGNNALYEKKSAKLTFINAGYWIVTLAIMGGIICAWSPAVA